MRDITALDLHYLTKEFQELVSSRIDTIYHPGDVLIRLHSAKLGKKIMRISKNFVFLTDFKEEQPINPTAFCMTMRKYLENARIKAVEQINFERVLKLTCEKEKTYFVSIELFGKGNVILADENNNELAALEKQAKKTQKKHNFLTLKEQELKKILKESEETLVKTLATELGLGGIYAEFALQEFDKNEKAHDMKETGKLYRKLGELKNRKIEPSLFNGKIVPFACTEKTAFKTFNEAVSAVLTKELEDAEKNKKLMPFTAKKEKIEKIIEAQKASIKELEKEADENAKKGEAIYNNYQLASEVLEQIKKAKEKLSWDEIKEKLKGHKIIKEIKEKEGKITIEL